MNAGARWPVGQTRGELLGALQGERTVSERLIELTLRIAGYATLNLWLFSGQALAQDRATEDAVLAAVARAYFSEPEEPRCVLIQVVADPAFRGGMGASP
jgi:hypothetical protein